MADEITVVTGLAVSNGGREAEMPVNRATYDQTGTDFVCKTQSIGITEEAITKGDIGADNGGLMYVKNLDDTNFVTIHATGETGGVKLLAGDHQVFRLNSTPYATADTAAVEIEYLLLEA